MRDIYEAIEKLTVVLALRIENAVRKRGWANKPVLERFDVAAPGRLAYPTRIALPLPLGNRVTFSPAEAPSDDKSSWKIQLKRSDGVTRHSWSDGLHVRQVDGGYQMFVRDEVLSEVQFKQILDELSATGLTGHAATICKAYVSRFGAASADVYEVLFSAQYVEQLELMHEAVLTGASQMEVEAELARLDKWKPAH
jgi:hypothetical protein